MHLTVLHRSQVSVSPVHRNVNKIILETWPVDIYIINLATGRNHFIMPQVGDMDQKQETSNSRLLQDTWLDIKLYLDFFCFNLKHVYEEKPFQKATNNNAIFCLMSQTRCLVCIY